MRQCKMLYAYSIIETIHEKLLVLSSNTKSAYPWILVLLLEYRKI